MKNELLNKLQQWHAKLAQFFDQSFARNQHNMACAQGCDRCCHVERSVFTIEADLIRKFVLERKPSLPDNAQAGRCAFLAFDGKCSVYEVRPSICRSHGLVLKHAESLSHCELNFLDGLPEREDWLASETADTILSTLQIAYEKAGATSERVALYDLWRELTKGIS